MWIRDRPTANSAIYGYKKDPEDKDHWLVDEEAAAVVRRIFRLAVEGHGPYEISKMLTAEKVECPGYYLAKQRAKQKKQGKKGGTSMLDKNRPYDWYGNTVSTLLERPEYMGPVSYTHLDVYKRQAMGQPGVQKMLQNGGLSKSGRRFHQRQGEILDILQPLHQAVRIVFDFGIDLLCPGHGTS